MEQKPNLERKGNICVEDMEGWMDVGYKDKLIKEKPKTQQYSSCRRPIDMTSFTLPSFQSIFLTLLSLSPPFIIIILIILSFTL